MLTYRYPVDDGYIVTSPFGPRGNGVHYGWDVVHQNRKTYLWGRSQILDVGYREETFGYYFDAYVDYIDNRRDWTRYAHLERKPNVEIGQTYDTGHEIGPMGETGFTTGIHLHIGTKRLLNINGIEQWVWVDPWLTIEMCLGVGLKATVFEQNAEIEQMQYQIMQQNNHLGECKTLLTERTAEVEDLKKKIKKK